MASFGDKFIAIDTWLIANFDLDILKDVLGKYINLLDAKKELEAMRAGKTIDSNSGDDNLEALNKYGIDLNKKAIDGLLAFEFDLGDEVKKITEEAMSGRLDFFESLIQRVALLKGMEHKKSIP